MVNYNDEYFYVSCEGENYPELDYAENGGNSIEIDRAYQLDTGTTRIMKFRDDMLVSPILGDLHCLRSHFKVISEQVKNLLEKFNLKEVQFLPTLIRDDKGNEHDGYYILHVYNEIKCMDPEESDWEEDVFNEGRADIEHLVLDNQKLEGIPLEERLVFKVWEDSLKLLFHKSVVEKILEIGPTGVYVGGVSEVGNTLPFIEEFRKKRDAMNTASDNTPQKEFESQVMRFDSCCHSLDMYLDLGSEAEEIAESMGMEINYKEDRAEARKIIQEAKDNHWLDKFCIAVLDDLQSPCAKMICCLEMLKSNIHPDKAREGLEEVVQEGSVYGGKATRLLEQWDNGNRSVEFEIKLS